MYVPHHRINTDITREPKTKDSAINTIKGFTIMN